MKIIILGIGQTFRSDDGAGLTAIHHWKEIYSQTANHPSITVEEIELPGLELIDLIKGFEAVILVDAVQSSVTPGTITRINEEDLLGFSEEYQSAHGWGVAETLQLARKLDIDLPERLIFVGIEGENFSPGVSLSPSVTASLNEAAQVIEDSVKILLYNSKK
jgi:hydrogenase maturation protease